MGADPVHFEIQLPADYFFGDELGIVPESASVKIAENHFPVMNGKMHEHMPAQLQIQLMQLPGLSQDELNARHERRAFFNKRYDMIHNGFLFM